MTDTLTVTRTGRRMDRSLRGEVRSRLRNLPGNTWGVGCQFIPAPDRPAGNFVQTLERIENEMQAVRVASLVPDLHTARFIAACREDVPDLLNECDRLEAENHALTIRLAQLEAMLEAAGATDTAGLRAGLWRAVRVAREHAERAGNSSLPGKELLYDRLRAVEDALTSMAQAVQ